MIEWFFNYSTCSPCTDLLRSLAVTFWKNLLKWVNFFGDKFYGGKCNFTGGWGVIFLGSDCSGAIIQTANIWEDGEGAIFSAAIVLESQTDTSTWNSNQWTIKIELTGNKNLPLPPILTKSLKTKNWGRPSWPSEKSL